MVRARPARNKKTDDIPIARRSNPSRSASDKRWLLFLGTLLVVGFLFSFVLLIRPPNINDFSEVRSPQKETSTPSTLLGHFPYPEAVGEDLIPVLPGLKVHKDTYKALRLMSSAASSDGIDLILLSAYRSIELQKEIFYGRKSSRNQIAIERAKVSAPPGYSEHSTGFAIDLGDGTMRETDFEVEFETTPAFKWLKKNAAKYHFVMSFPRGNPQKVSYEPWHWRYEGTVEALKQFKDANELRRSQEKTDKPKSF